MDLDKLGQAAYTGQLAVVTDALTKNKQLAHVADTVGNYTARHYSTLRICALLKKKKKKLWYAFL